MELKWTWLVIVLVVVTIAWILLWSFPSPLNRAPRNALPVAHAARLRRIPRYRTLAARRRVEMALRVAAVLVLIAGCILLSGRLVETKTHQAENTNRDIMLCLDVSGSMIDYDAQVVEEFQRITEGLEGERIGLTIWSGVAVTVFPLTDDYEFIVDQLDLATEKFNSYDYNYVAGTYLGDERASLVSDGLVSCVERFDRPDEERGRAVVLASDNDPQGEPIYTFDEAAQYAADRNVVVHGLGTPEMDYLPGSVEEFERAMKTTKGTFSVFGEDGTAASIVDQINTLEQARSKQPARTTILDRPGLGAALMGAGLLLVVAAGVRRKS
ncbi:hypothetical protein [Nocardioides sp. AE5]|uniref:hypothetical protein n=1 Tax=Nocardioides sp. AE5 TaxID=2962573 RepID=UPI00288131B5|nr:hypothetical protein [Nocardioides sp. AE5]MDT0201113.1 hypothetical protein [Nocardioides sp. AE5]